MIDKLESFEIATVEELSALSDANLHICLGLRHWRDKAVEFLKDTPSRERLDRVEAENAKLKEQLRSLEARFKKPARRKAIGRLAKRSPPGTDVAGKARVEPVTAAGVA